MHQHDGDAAGGNSSSHQHVPQRNQQNPPSSQNQDLSSMFPTQANRYSLPQMLDSNPVALSNIAVGASNPEQMLYQESLNGVTNLVASIPQKSENSSKESSQQQASILPFQPPNAMGAPQIVGSVGNHPKIGTLHIPSTFSTQQPAVSTTLGGVSIPPLPPNASTALQVQVAAAAAAAAAAPPKGYHGPKPGSKAGAFNPDNKANLSVDGRRGLKRGGVSTELTSEEKKKQNRERNREHAKSTRARKKAYVNKLKELVDGLHAERSEEARKRRVAVQHLAEVQRVRRAVIKTFLKYHANYEPDERKWSPYLEETFFLKQPVTPYRSFRKVEIENTRDRVSGLQCDSFLPNFSCS